MAFINTAAEQLAYLGSFAILCARHLPLCGIVPNRCPFCQLVDAGVQLPLEQYMLLVHTVSFITTALDS
jgi:hypothetical protein